MLIVTNRHTENDLQLWKEYEEIDAVYIPRVSTKEQRSLDEIKTFSKINCYLGVSWGKDSVVVADIAMRGGLDITLVHLYCIPSHNPECDKVRDEFLKIYPACKYQEIIVDYSTLYAQNLCPQDQDKLTDIEWYKGFKKAGDLFGHRHISGVRGQESNVRTLRMKRWGMSTENTCAPIGYWSEQEVFSYLKKYDLPIHPNYAMLGGGRWTRERLRVAEIGDIHGTGGGRAEWEREYYPDIIARIHASTGSIIDRR
jgi:phosphoadenosine phosphosulfate reductase